MAYVHNVKTKHSMEESVVYDQLNVNWTGTVNGLGIKKREDFTENKMNEWKGLMWNSTIIMVCV